MEITQTPHDNDEWMSSLADVPALCLNGSTRNFLAARLDPETPMTTDDCLSRDWRGVAEVLGVGYVRMATLTGMVDLLRDWTPEAGATLGRLCEAIARIRRADVLDEPMFRHALERDRRQYLRQQAADLERSIREENAAGHRPEQVNEVSSQSEVRLAEISNNQVPLTVDDMRDGSRTRYDAFIIAAPQEETFVRELLRKLEGERGYRLFLKERNLLSNLDYYASIAKLLRERCTKVIIVLSPNFLASADCQFQMNQAFALCPGMFKNLIIPIMYLECAIPHILVPICPLYYTRSTFIVWFWDRLDNSLKDRSLPAPAADDVIDDVAMTSSVFPMSAVQCARSSTTTLATGTGTTTMTTEEEEDTEEKQTPTKTSWSSASRKLKLFSREKNRKVKKGERRRKVLDTQENEIFM